MSTHRDAYAADALLPATQSYLSISPCSGAWSKLNAPSTQGRTSAQSRSAWSDRTTGTVTWTRSP